jgi:hypothetical protein
MAKSSFIRVFAVLKVSTFCCRLVTVALLTQQKTKRQKDSVAAKMEFT